MAMLFNITEGWTGRLGPFFIEAKLPPPEGSGNWERFDCDDFTVTFGWRKGTGEWEEAPGEFVAADDLDDNTGAFYYLPDDETDFVVTDPLPKQSYYVRANVVDDDDKVVTAPSGVAAEIVVHRK
jgi:hypothetical protein